MTRARMPRPHEVAAARRDPRLLRAVKEQQGDGAWRIRGACQAVDPETFFPAPTEPADAAVALCRTCDVQGACLAWALDVGDCHGVWGATTPRERRAMLVAWRSEGQRPGLPGQSDPRFGAVACLPILPLQRASRNSEKPDPVGAGAPQ
jgi:WhiB family transcriptional regulator, redox-sensing transcriptional regulator